MAGAAGFCFVDADRPVRLIVAGKAFGCRIDDCRVVEQYAVDVKIGGIIWVAAGAISRAIDCGAVPFGAGSELAMFVLVVTGPAIVVVQVSDQVATGVMTAFTGAVGG